MGKHVLRDELIPYTFVPPYEQDPTYYYDWEGEAEFVLGIWAPAECAGGALEMIDDRMLEADQELYQAKLLVEKHQYALSVNKSYRAVLAAAKGLLVTEGLDPQPMRKRSRNLISGWRARASCPPRTPTSALSRRSGFPRMPAPRRPQKMAFAKRFLAVCRAATEQMGKDLKLAQVKEEVLPTPASKRCAGRAGVHGTGVRLARRCVSDELCEDQTQARDDG